MLCLTTAYAQNQTPVESLEASIPKELCTVCPLLAGNTSQSRLQLHGQDFQKQFLDYMKGSPVHCLHSDEHLQLQLTGCHGQDESKQQLTVDLNVEVFLRTSGCS